MATSDLLSDFEKQRESIKQKRESIKQKRESIKQGLKHYLDCYKCSENIDYESKQSPDINIRLEDLDFYKIVKITYEEKAPRIEALENVLSNLRILGINVLFLIIGNSNSVSFYYGISKDLIQNRNKQVNIADWGYNILKPSIEGNFRGSKVIREGEGSKKQIIETIKKMRCGICIQGVPNLIKDNEHFQSVDRLVDVMKGDNFVYLVTAKYLPPEQVNDLENNIYEIYDVLKRNSKTSEQSGNSSSITKIDTYSKGTNTTEGKSHSDSKTKNYGSTTQNTRTTPDDRNNERTSSITKIDATNSSSTQESDSKSESTTRVDTINQGDNNTTSNSSSITTENSSKIIDVWLKYIDDILLKRLDIGKNKGVFITNISLFTMTNSSLLKLFNTVGSLFSGDSGTQTPLIKKDFELGSWIDNAIRNFQIPIYKLKSAISKYEVQLRTVLSQYTNEQYSFFCNWYTVGELGIVAGLPQKEVVGLKLKEEVEFGLNYKDVDPKYKLELGNLIQGGTELENNVVSLDLNDLSKHIFVTGSTGSGKTTTCQKILLKSRLPFMVIEPAKTEYRILSGSCDDLLIFTMGRDDIGPFRINPLEFFPHETISSHVDMLKASIESAFDMDAAIPQIIEKAIYECYRDFGWNLTTKVNKYYDNPYADGIYSFPTFRDLVKKCEDVVKVQGFDQRLKDEYIGSINARLQGLMVGAKEQMLCTPRSVDFSELIHKKVIIELEDIRNGSEKALIMGFVISNLIEAIKAEYYKNPNFKHITLIEEAHRLLSSYSPGDSLTKKNAVEIFADMLAEVRKYGEALIIVDQIPSKLTSEVLKNTNTKIVHKLFGEDEHNAIGNTISVKKEQKDVLSCLNIGRAVVFSQGWEDSLQIQVTRETDTLSIQSRKEQDLIIKNKAISYYCSNYKKGWIPVLKYLKDKPGTVEFKYLMEKVTPLLSELDKEFHAVFKQSAKNKILSLQKIISELQNYICIEKISEHILDEFFDPLQKNLVDTLLSDIVNGNFELSDYNDKFNFRRK